MKIIAGLLGQRRYRIVAIAGLLLMLAGSVVCARVLTGGPPPVIVPVRPPVISPIR